MSDPYPTMPGSSPGKKTSLIKRLLSRVRREPENREGILTVLDAARARNLIDTNAYSMLKGALAVSDMAAVEIMVPRAQMDMLDVNVPLKNLVPRILEMAHSRFPVFDESRDNLIGIFMTKDLLRYVLNPSLTLRDLTRPAVFIPESKRVNVLLQEFRQQRNHIAIVIDEHGGVTGLVTLEDVLEQIVGSIEDEFDDSEQTIFADGLQTWRVMATTEVDTLNEALACSLPEGDYETIGGWFAHTLGRIPKRGDRLQQNHMQFEVLRADARRALWIRIRKLPDTQSTSTTSSTGSSTPSLTVPSTASSSD
ncbi:MAG: CBS domain-containing protein [Burkholderiaceae bacterium]|nr:CBS domain-containing protein [Burkholderiaceae bacterium]